MNRMGEKPGDVDVEDNSIDIEEIKVAKESSSTLSFRKKRGLSPHRLPLKERIEDRMISYVDLFRPDPNSPRLDSRRKPQASTRLS